MNILVAVAAILLLCCSPVAAGDQIAAVVHANFPEDLLSSEEYGGDVRRSQFHVVDLDGEPASKEIAVVYSDAGAGLLCAITSAESSPARSCAEHRFTGTNATLELIDLESDGRPEFAVSFSSTGNGARYVWIYRWENGWKELGTSDAPFKDPIFIDLDGDGDLDLLDGLRFGSDVQSTWLWDATYFERGTSDVIDWMTAIRTEGPPTRFEHSISVPTDPSASYRLRVITDGDVSSATIRGNEKVVFGPHDFRPRTRLLISDPIVLDERSVITIELDGTPGARLFVLVEAN